MTNKNSSLPSLVALINEVVYVLVGGHGQFAEVLHVRPEGWMLAHPKVPFVLGVEEVSHPLAVDLHVRYLHLILGDRKMLLILNTYMWARQN